MVVPAIVCVDADSAALKTLSVEIGLIAIDGAIRRFWVAEDKFEAEKVRVYVAPNVPEIPTFEKLAIPLTAVTVAVPTMLAPVLTVIVTALVLPVTVFPWASRIATTGCVTKAAPVFDPAALVVRTN